MRALLVVTHLLGAGHLTRTAAIARALAADGHEVTLVSGGRPTPLVATNRVRFVQLPPVQAVVGDLRTLLDEACLRVGAGRLAARRETLLRTFDDALPDILITELFPFGRRALAAEFLAVLEAAEARSPRPLIACSVRDILAPPSTAAKAEETGRIVKRFYDLVLVHGDSRIVRLDASWPEEERIARRIAYTGYVDGGVEAEAETETEGPGLDLLVSAGSSSAGLPLYRAAIEAGRLAPDLSWRVLVGHGVAEKAFRGLRDSARSNTHVERARPDFRAMLRTAGVFIGQAGYNTVMDLFATGVRSVLVPFAEGGETEQTMRATRLAAAGLASVLPEAELTPASLVAAARQALAGPRPSSAGIGRDGARRTADLVVAGAERRPDTTSVPRRELAEAAP